MTSSSEFGISLYAAQLIELNEYYLQAVQSGFNEEQAFTLTVKLLELTVAVAIAREIHGDA